jgi:hypothetical protein
MAHSRKFHSGGLLVALLLALLPAAPGFAAPTYSDPVPFARPGFGSTELLDINDGGTIVGDSWSGNGNNVGFVYSSGVFTSVEDPSATLGTSVTGIANDGTLVVVSYSGDPLAPSTTSFIGTVGSFTPFSVPGAVDTAIRRISSDGRYLTGTWTDSNGGVNGFAYDRKSSTLTTFADLQSAETIVQGASVQGVVVGSYKHLGQNNTLTKTAFVYDLVGQTWTEYADVNGLGKPRFRDINDAGLIAGFTASGLAFVGSPGDWTVLAPAPAGFSQYAMGLNNAGVLLGNTIDDATGLDVQGWISTPVPEAASWAMFALGLALMAWRARRRLPS